MIPRLYLFIVIVLFLWLPQNKKKTFWVLPEEFILVFIMLKGERYGNDEDERALPVAWIERGWTRGRGILCGLSRNASGHISVAYETP